MPKLNALRDKCTRVRSTILKLEIGRKRTTDHDDQSS